MKASEPGPVGPGPTVGDVVDLARRLRAAGAEVSPAQVHALLFALDVLEPIGPGDLYRAARLSLCTSPADLALFDAVLDAGTGGAELGPAPLGLPGGALPAGDGPPGGPAGPEGIVPVPAPADGAAGELAEDQTVVVSASTGERLGGRDLARLSPAELDEILALTGAFAAPGEQRRSGRWRAAPRGRPDRPHPAPGAGGGGRADTRRLPPGGPRPAGWSCSST